MSTTDTEALDQTAMRQLAAGDDRALDALMERHAAGLHQFLARFTGDSEEARDLAQEAFVRVYRHRQRFRSGRRFTTWLYAIAANLARNHLRWRGRHAANPLTSEDPETGRGGVEPAALTARGPAPDQAAESTERITAVRRAVGQLPPDLREALVLCEWEALAVAEAAAVLRTTPKAVESRLYRARQRLRQDLARWLV